jgi:hypothetical protein
MHNKEQIDFIIPSFKSKILTSLCIQSFEKYKSNFNFRYIIVENSDDESYKQEILNLADDILWIQNPTKARGSAANAVALEEGLKHVESEYVFLCHNDVVACHPHWMDFLFSKLHEDGFALAGTVLDLHPQRQGAVHISGLLTTSKIATSVSMYPIYENGNQTHDVGDLITEYCLKNDLRCYCCNNTLNNEEIQMLLSDDNLYNKFHVDRALNDDNEVIYLHLGRGIEKTQRAYHKPNRVYIDEWEHFVISNIF